MSKKQRKTNKADHSPDIMSFNLLHIDDQTSFFSKWGIYLILCIKMMHITVLLLYLNHNSTYYKLTDQLDSLQRSTSGKEKIAGANKTSVSNPMIKPPTTLAIKISCYRLQSLHGIPLIFGVEI
jgi:hypothetical protein